MSVTEKIMEVIDEVLDEREKEAILSVPVAYTLLTLPTTPYV